jgi:hypothetical protein
MIVLLAIPHLLEQLELVLEQLELAVFQLSTRQMHVIR